jgi:hypothetical protein
MLTESLLKNHERAFKSTTKSFKSITKTFNFKVQFEECNAETTNIKCGLAVIFKEFISEGWHVLSLVKKTCWSQAIENN